MNVKQKIDDFINGKFGVILEDKTSSVEFLKLCADRNLRWADGRIANHSERNPITPCVVEYYSGSLSCGRYAFYTKQSYPYKQYFKSANAEIVVNTPTNIVIRVSGGFIELNFNENTKMWLLSEFGRK